MRPSREITAAKQRIWLRLIRNDQLVLAVLALTAGIGGAYSAIAFRLGIDAVQLIFYGAPSEEVYATALELEWWHLLLAPTLPVLESRQTMKLAGVIRHRDAILSYNQALIGLRRQEHGET